MILKQTLSRFSVNFLIYIGNLILVVLLHETFRTIVEISHRMIAPPLVQVAVLVEQSAFIVETRDAKLDIN